MPIFDVASPTLTVIRHRGTLVPVDLSAALSILDEDVEDTISSVYLDLVRRPDTTEAALRRDSPLSEGVFTTVLEVLVRRGFVTRRAGGVVEVHPPDLAMPQWAAAAERAARQTRWSASALTQAYLRARDHHSSPGPDPTRGLHSASDIESARATLIASATAEVIAVWAVGRQVRSLLDPARRTHDVPLTGPGGTPIRRRAIYDSSLLDEDGTVDVLMRRRAAGEEIRLGRRVPFSIVVADDQACLVEFPAEAAARGPFGRPGAGRTGAGRDRSQGADGTSPDDVPDHGASTNPAVTRAYLLPPGPVSTGVLHLAERSWALTVPLPEMQHGTVVAGLTDRDRLLLSLLASGVPDATAARQLGISQRTVERRIRHILDALGARSRFQAGVEATRRGLI